MTAAYGNIIRAAFSVPVRVAIDHIESRDDDLHPTERALITNAVPKRRFEFSAGRRLARRLLGDVVLLADNRCPIWPDGTSGSIAHAGGLCVVVVASSDVTIGIDLEPNTPLAANTEQLVCTAAERDRLPHDATRGLVAKSIFCAKEAFYKAQWPVTRQTLDFLDVEVQLHGARFELETVNPWAIARVGGFIRADAEFVFAGTAVDRARL